MQDNEKKPALRFKGFTDPWEQRKLGDLCVEFRSGEFISASDITETGEYPVFGGNGLRGFTDRFNHDGEYTLIGRQGALCGNVNFAVGKSYFTEHAIAVRADKKNQTRFLYYLFSTMDLGQYSGQSAQPGLAVGNLVELKSTLPDKQEQEKISGVLTALDTLITLHQRKYEKLVNIKKSMLDKMFPKNGASVPEIRFKGFTDPWEQRKLGDITVELSEYATQELGLPLLTSSRSGLMYQDEYRDSRTTKSTETLFSVVPVGTCTYRHMSDDDVFHMNINTLEKGLVSREYPVFEASKGNNLEFLVQHINSSEEFKAFCAEQKKGGTRTRLYYNTLCQFTVRVPALKEQAQISQCLKKLDTLITLHQRKLEKLQNIKKSCLEKMFV